MTLQLSLSIHKILNNNFNSASANKELIGVKLLIYLLVDCLALFIYK